MPASVLHRTSALPLLAAILAPGPAAALEIMFNSGGTQTIVDNGIGDTNMTLGIIDFNTVVGSYGLVGTLDTGAGSNLTALITPAASVRLTNFAATAIGIPTFAIGILFSDTIAGTYTNPVAADSIDPFGDNAVNTPILANIDNIIDWVGFVDNNLIPGPPLPNVPPFGNAFVPAFSLPVPYTIPNIWHAAATVPGTFVNPAFGARLTFQLGGADNQLILQSSANVGIAPAPEPATAALLVLGLGGLVVRRRKLSATTLP